MFTLIMDNFGIKFLLKNDLNHLIGVLQKLGLPQWTSSFVNATLPEKGTSPVRNQEANQVAKLTIPTYSSKVWSKKAIH
ncbi:hypothetical protein ACHAW6_001166 [Cyclotella cf. meneghiniana]